MSQLEVRKNSATLLEIEITPDRDGRWFWLLWAASGTFFLSFGWYHLPESKMLRAAPIWAIILFWMGILVVTALVFITGWHGWTWASRGLEKLRIESGELIYEREGSILDRKLAQIPLSDISEFVVLWFGLGDERNRIQVRTKGRSLYLGRNLSKAQGRELSDLLRSALSRHGMAI